MYYLRLESDGRFVYDAVNSATLSAIDMRQEDILGRTPEDALGHEYGSIMTAGLRSACSTGQPYEYQPTMRRPHGERIFDVVYTPQVDEEGRVAGVVCIARDITKERSLEVALDHLARMSALGQMSSGIVHDFTSLLANIGACFALLGRQVDSGKGRRIVAEGKRMVVLGRERADRIMAFAHKQTLETSVLDINAVVLDAKGMLERALRPGISIELSLWPSDSGSIRGRKSQIELALLNLALNARDAMPAGGTVTIETRRKSLPVGDDRLTAGDYVVLSVSDTGEGMPPDVLANVLKPFYTTKPPGKGTGLGLSMADGMMREIGGKIDVTSSVGAGTCVSLYFPSADAAKV